MAALIAFYEGKRGEETTPLQDDEVWLTRYAGLWSQLQAGKISLNELVHDVLAQAEHWEQDLTALPGLTALVTEQLQVIRSKGMRAALKQYCLVDEPQL